jgi:hypothetical protein
MAKRWREFCRPICDECLEDQAHEGHGPGSGLIVYRSETHIKETILPNGRLKREEKVINLPPIPIEQDEFRCRKCFPR